MWVAVGTGTNSIAYSTDGKNWTGLGNTIFGEGKGVSWTGTKWVALGSVNRIAYSYDGINWVGVSNSNAIFSSYGGRLAWKKNVYPSISHLSSRINDINSSLTGNHALQSDLSDLSTNILKRYEDASFGTVEIRDNLIVTDLSLTNLDVSNKFKVAVNQDISGVIGKLH